MQKERFAVALRVIGNSLSKSSFSLDKKKKNLGDFGPIFTTFFYPFFYSLLHSLPHSLGKNSSVRVH